MNASPLLAAPAQAALAPMAQAPTPGTDPKEAAKQFEGLLMANLFQELRKTVHHSGLLGDGGSARSTYEYLLDQAVVNNAMDANKPSRLRDALEASLKAARSK